MYEYAGCIIGMENPAEPKMEDDMNSGVHWRSRHCEDLRDPNPEIVSPSVS